MSETERVRELTGADIEAWEGLIRQCEQGDYLTINIASKKRRNLLLKVDRLIRDAKVGPKVVKE